MARKRANGEGNIKTYLDAADKRGLLPMFYLELVSGLRKGELTALLWSDLDIADKTISVRSSFALSAYFRVWVRVWVSTAGSAGVGQFLLAGEWSHFALLETIKWYHGKDTEPPDGEQCSRRVALQVFGMGQNVGQRVFSASRNGGRTS